jgi:hypothetical protein
MKHARRTISTLLVCMTALAAMNVACTAAAEPGVKDEVLKLLQAGVEEAVVLEFIKKNGPPDGLTADAIIELKKAGASEKVLLALMPTSSAKTFPFSLDDKYEVAEPVKHGVMAVYPIRRTAPAAIGAYLTLDEASDKKVIVVKEKEEGSVPVVTILNNAKLPIYISSGEIIIGGKQDRMVAYDVIIQPKAEMTIEVRCVEQGRWRGARQEFSSAKAMGNLKSRSAVQFKDQGAVWNEVAAQNSSVNATTDTSTYQATLDSDEVKKLTEQYQQAILSSLEGRHMAGMVVAINGEVHAIEMFGSPAMFNKMKEKLLKAYVLDVIAVKDEKAKAPGPDAILKFYKETMKEQLKSLKEYSGNANFYRTSSEAESSDSIDLDGNLMRRQLLNH